MLVQGFRLRAQCSCFLVAPGQLRGVSELLLTPKLVSLFG